MDSNLDISTEKLGREVRSLINSAKESKIISECVSVDKVRKSRRDFYESSVQSPQSAANQEKRGRSRASSNNSNCSDASSKNADAKRSMRSQNVEFVMKQKKFLKAFTGRITPDVVEDEGGKSDKRDLLPIASVIDKFGRSVDPFCWQCHKEGSQMICCICPRTYHSKCLSGKVSNTTPIEGWACPECVGIMNADNTDNRSPAMRRLTLTKLTSLLKYALNRMDNVAGCEPFIDEVNSELFPQYDKYIINPMNLKKLRENVTQGKYGSTCAFVADARWILHNSIIFNTCHAKLTTVAKNIMKVCRREMNEIETCPECYQGANTRLDWFVQVCTKPHLLLWAKLKGFPYWPAKAMAVSNNGLVDVRFFGAHDKAWLKPSECYLYSTQDPNANNKQRKNEIMSAITELNAHIEKLSLKWGPFKPARFKTPYSLQGDEIFLKMMLPNYVPKEGIKNDPIVVPCSPDEKSKADLPKRTSSFSSSSSSPQKDTANMQPKVVLTAYVSKLDRNVFTEGYDTEDEEAVLEETGNIIKSDSSMDSSRNISHLYEHDLEIGEVITTYERNKTANKTMSSHRKIPETGDITGKKTAAGKRLSRSKSVCLTPSESQILQDSDEDTAKSPIKSGSIDLDDPEKLVLEIRDDNEPSGVGKRKRTLSDVGSPCKKVKPLDELEALKPVTSVQSKMRSRGKSVDSRLMMRYREAIEKKKQSESANKSTVDCDDLNTSNDDILQIDIDEPATEITKINETSPPIAKITKVSVPTSTPVDKVKSTSVIKESNPSVSNEPIASVAKNRSTLIPVEKSAPINDVASTPVAQEPSTRVSVDSSSLSPRNDISNSGDSNNFESCETIPDGLEHVSIENVVSIREPLTNSESCLKTVKKSKPSPKKQTDDNNSIIQSINSDLVTSPEKITAVERVTTPTAETSESPDKVNTPVTTSEIISSTSEVDEACEDSIFVIGSSDSSNVTLKISDLENNISTEKSDDALESPLVINEPISPRRNVKNDAATKSPKAKQKSVPDSPKSYEKSLETIRELRRLSVGGEETPVQDSVDQSDGSRNNDEAVEMDSKGKEKETFVTSLCLRPSDSPTSSTTKTSHLMTRNMTNTIINGQSKTLHNTSIKRIAITNNSSTKNGSPEKNANDERGAAIIKKSNDIIKTVEAIPNKINEKVLSPSKNVIIKKTVSKTNGSPSIIVRSDLKNVNEKNDNKRKIASPNLFPKKYKNANEKNVTLNKNQIGNNITSALTNGNVAMKVMVRGKNVYLTNKSLLANSNNKQTTSNTESETQQTNHNVKKSSELNVSNSMVFIPTDAIFTRQTPVVSTNQNTMSNADSNDQSSSDSTNAAHNDGVQTISATPPLIANSATVASPGTVRVVPQAYLLNTPVTTTASPKPNSNVENVPMDTCASLNNSIPPNSAGIVSKILNDSAYKMSEYFRHLLEESINSVASQSHSPEAQVVRLKAQLEKLKWQHMVKLRELKHNTEMQIREIRACLEGEKQRAIQEVKRQAEIDKITAINETKKKEWCTVCGREAILYCCRNAMYCNNSCQQGHWIKHVTNCLQAEENPNIQRMMNPAGMSPTGSTGSVGSINNNTKTFVLKRPTTSTSALLRNVSLLATTTSQLPPGYKLVPASTVISSSSILSPQSNTPAVIISQQFTNSDTNTENVQRITVTQDESNIATS